MNLSRLILKANIMRARALSRAVRDKEIEKVTSGYLKRFLPEPGEVEEVPATKDDGPEKIFSLWLQGENNAPPLVKACFRSIRHNCTQPLVVLDENSVADYIELPDVIMDKRRRGKIGNAHFADIVRVELLHNHGGFWLDATCFVTRPIDRFIVEQDFFLFLAGTIHPYTFIQNYFIRARKGAYLLEAWRAMIHKYWTQEPDAITYFVHQLLFKTLAQNDPRAIARFAEMRRIDQDPTHWLWWSSGKKPFDRKAFEQMTACSFFQKTAYGSSQAKNPPPGSFADEMINQMYL